jgi:hypothetical protein
MAPEPNICLSSAALNRVSEQHHVIDVTEVGCPGPDAVLGLRLSRNVRDEELVVI